MSIILDLGGRYDNLYSLLYRQSTQNKLKGEEMKLCKNYLPY